MKNIAYAIVLVLVAIVTMKLTHYSERMREYNTHICKVEGYQPDCKTPLDTSDYLK